MTNVFAVLVYIAGMYVGLRLVFVRGAPLPSWRERLLGCLIIFLATAVAALILR